MPYLSASEVMIHEEALCQVYVPLIYLFVCLVGAGNPAGVSEPPAQVS